ncbi:hypothetical protein O8C85_05450 [Aliarcobacter butzleri]|uniref:hypothetical protein n=1 Tax=Aliarcobacter butzleri TaxID=28197 RepID=UPI00263CB395|nr:hypothetical protein [Aliarcobacter butzleri]MDN5097971.1 hypothetical protein [Aliarcobacter butzleri]
MKSTKWIKIFFGLSLFMFLFVGIFNYKIDSLGLLSGTTLDKVAEELSNGKIIAGLGNIDERIFRKKQIEYLKNDVEYVAIGSSRIMQLRKSMFLNDGINNFQNYSVSGASIEDYIALLQIHKNKFGILPKNVILGLDAWIFNKNNDQTRYTSLSKEYDEFLEILNVNSLKKSNKEETNKIKISYFISLDYFRENIKEFKKNQSYFIVDSIEVDEVLRMPDGSIYYPYKNRFPDFNEVENISKSYAQGSVYSLERYEEISNIEIFEKLITYLKNNGVNVYFYLTPYHPTTYDILILKEKYKIIDKIEIYVKEFAKQNNIKVVGSYNPHKLNLKNEHFFDGMHSLDVAYEIIFKDLLK